MQYEIKYKPAFSTIFVTLGAGESITAEAGAMVSMDGALTMKTSWFGGFFSAILKSWFGGESLFANTFINQTNQPRTLVLTQALVGDIEALALEGRTFGFEPGTYIAHVGNVKLGVRWAGFKSWFSGEGLFKLQATGDGIVFFGGYGGISKRRVSGEFVVDTGHLLAYESTLKINLGLAGGLLGSFTSGEGFVMKLVGRGDVYMQSRSIDGLVKFLRPKL
jgi:uncharacterized protein (TIGR00266 family)